MVHSLYLISLADFNMLLPAHTVLITMTRVFLLSSRSLTILDLIESLNPFIWCSLPFVFFLIFLSSAFFQFPVQKLCTYFIRYCYQFAFVHLIFHFKYYIYTNKYTLSILNVTQILDFIQFTHKFEEIFNTCFYYLLLSLKYVFLSNIYVIYCTCLIILLGTLVKYQ